MAATAEATRKKTKTAESKSVTKTPRAAGKSVLLDKIVKEVGVTKAQAREMVATLVDFVKAELKRGPGAAAVPGLVLLKRVKKPATKGGSRPNPFKPGEMMAVKPRPATVIVKARIVKGLRDHVAG